ncbi:MAG: DUF6062 family protein [Christensenellales bacterium]|jgi:hypothetical protein
MKYHIDTIPIWDAFKAAGECPLCDIYNKCESEFVERSLGGSVMEPDTRVQVNKQGFCGEHLSQLYAQQNRLGLALMMHSHIKEIIAELDKQEKELAVQMEIDSKKRGLERAARAVTKSAPSVAMTHDIAAIARTRIDDCYICSRLKSTMDRYVKTVVAMWENEKEFQKAFRGSKGFCLKHYSQLLDAGASCLMGAKHREFTSALVGAQRENIARIEKELEWFTLKFDYRNKDKPWGGSRDAVERTLLKLRSWQGPAGQKKKEE